MIARQPQMLQMSAAVETGRMSALTTEDMSAVETGPMSAAETGQMSAVETRQMSAVETRQMLRSQIRGWAQNHQNVSKWVEKVARPRESTHMNPTAVLKPLG